MQPTMAPGRLFYKRQTYHVYLFWISKRHSIVRELMVGCTIVRLDDCLIEARALTTLRGKVNCRSCVQNSILPSLHRLRFG